MNRREMMREWRKKNGYPPLGPRHRGQKKIAYAQHKLDWHLERIAQYQAAYTYQERRYSREYHRIVREADLWAKKLTSFRRNAPSPK